MHFCMYIEGFRARQHLGSLAPVIDDDDGQMIFGDLRGLKLLDICLTDEGKPRKIWIVPYVLHVLPISVVSI